jgi:hypothetical protein
MIMADPRTQNNSVVAGNHYGPALGAQVAIALMKKQLDATKVQGASAMQLMEAANPPKPSASVDGKVGSRFSAYA